MLTTIRVGKKSVLVPFDMLMMQLTSLERSPRSSDSSINSHQRNWRERPPDATYGKYRKRDRWG